MYVDSNCSVFMLGTFNTVYGLADISDMVTTGLYFLQISVYAYLQLLLTVKNPDVCTQERNVYGAVRTLTEVEK